MLRSFSYTGSKTQVFRQGRMVLNHLPYRHGYIEPFAGSMAILLNRDPSRVEVANDIDNNIVNLLEVIRQQPQELYQQMLLTPYHETEFYNNCATLAEGDALERARKMWSVLNASWLGGPRGNKMLIPSTRKSSQGCPVEPAKYKRFHGRIIEMAKRLQNVTFLCRDAIAVIKQYNYKHYVIYCDPPYRNSGNFYQNGIDHAALLAASCGRRSNNCLSPAAAS